MPDRQYLTAAEFKTKTLGIPYKSLTDDQIDDYLQVATGEVEKFTERIFSQATYEETFRGDGTTTRLVWEYPIISVTSMYQDTIANPTVTTAYDVNRLVLSDLNLEVGRIELDGLDDITSFSAASLYRLTYVGGYATVPIGVKHATALWAAELMRQNWGLSPDGRTSGDIIPITSEQIVEILAPLRRRRI